MSAKKQHEGHTCGMEAPKRRRARCCSCEGCKEVDCKTFQACRDMPKHRGAWKVKKGCVERKRSQPLLPVAAACTCTLQCVGWMGHNRMDGELCQTIGGRLLLLIVACICSDAECLKVP